MNDRAVKLGEKTIKAVLGEFLEVQRKRLKPSTMLPYVLADGREEYLMKKKTAS